MSEFKGTPGPWAATRGTEYDPNRWIVCQSTPEHELPWHIATIENGAPGDTLETEGHNARLIAATPDLLEACKRAIPLLRLLTIRQIIDGGDAAIQAAGLNPYCLNEGADPNARLDPWFIDAAISNATES